jgi:cation diffusion facilitator CzcD-associated flavoprotein CzcO
MVIDAGISGMYLLYRPRQLGVSVRVLEAGSDFEGTRYWNPYPGARFDSESWTYGYSFFERAAAGMGLEGAFFASARHAGISQPGRGQVRFAP